MVSFANETPAMATNPKLVFFTDFDGTITTSDSNDFLVDNFGFGATRRIQGDNDVLHGRRNLREWFQEMMDGISEPLDACINALAMNMKLDPGFKEFYMWAKRNNVPVVILSGGVKPVIRALLDKLLGENDIQIVSNDVCSREGMNITDAGGWTVDFHDDSIHGHDKAIEIRKYARLPNRPIMFYAGDGVSDLCAARETDFLFAKEGKDLVTWCESENIPFITFSDWFGILRSVQEILSLGKASIHLQHISALLDRFDEPESLAVPSIGAVA